MMRGADTKNSDEQTDRLIESQVEGQTGAKGEESDLGMS